MPAPQDSALSDDEFDALEALLDAHSPFDGDGLHGLLHAVVIAPTLMPPPTWLPIVFPRGFPDAASAKEFLSLVMRRYTDVVRALREHVAVTPEPDDVPGCASFAAGFVAGAELDAAWLESADRWTFASPFAYLAGRLDRASKPTIAKIEQNLAPNPKQMLREELGEIVAAAYDSFALARRAREQLQTVKKEARVGRNEPCPCGSGKKFKRCCVDKKESGASS